MYVYLFFTNKIQNTKLHVNQEITKEQNKTKIKLWLLLGANIQSHIS